MVSRRANMHANRKVDTSRRRGPHLREEGLWSISERVAFGSRYVNLNCADPASLATIVTTAFASVVPVFASLSLPICCSIRSIFSSSSRTAAELDRVFSNSVSEKELAFPGVRSGILAIFFPNPSKVAISSSKASFSHSRARS